MTANIVRNLYAQKLTRFLSDAPGDTWHYVAQLLNVAQDEGSYEVARWMIEQPRCERAVATTLLWRYYELFPAIQQRWNDEPGPRDYVPRLVRQIIDRAQHDGFPHAEIGWEAREWEEADPDHPRRSSTMQRHRRDMRRAPTTTLQIPAMLMPFSGRRPLDWWDHIDAKQDRFLQTNLMSIGAEPRHWGNRVSFFRLLAYQLGYRRHRLRTAMIWWVALPTSLVAFLAIRDWYRGAL